MILPVLLIHDADDLRAFHQVFDDFSTICIEDPQNRLCVDLFFNKPGHARKAQRLADAINAAMRDPSEDPAERAKLDAILNPKE